MKNKTRQIPAAIGLLIIGLLVSGCAPSTKEDTVVKTRSGIPNLGGKSEAELLTDCQIDIQNKLSNPRSMDIIYSGLKYKKEVNHELWLQFYAKNQLNAESKHTGKCEFDDNGVLLASKFE